MPVGRVGVGPTPQDQAADVHSSGAGSNVEGCLAIAGPVCPVPIKANEF